MEWYNSIGLFNKQTYIVPMNPIVISFCHYQYRICLLKQNLFGWFTYKGCLTATCWNNRTVRVESAPGKTFHKLLVGGVYSQSCVVFTHVYRKVIDFQSKELDTCVTSPSWNRHGALCFQSNEICNEFKSLQSDKRLTYTSIDNLFCFKLERGCIAWYQHA